MIIYIYTHIYFFICGSMLLALRPVSSALNSRHAASFGKILSKPITVHCHVHGRPSFDVGSQRFSGLRNAVLINATAEGMR